MLPGLRESASVRIAAALWLGTNLQLVRLQAFVSLLALQDLKSTEALLKKTALVGDTARDLGALHQSSTTDGHCLSAASADFIFPDQQGGQSMNHADVDKSGQRNGLISRAAHSSIFAAICM